VPNRFFITTLILLSFSFTSAQEIPLSAGLLFPDVPYAGVTGTGAVTSLGLGTASLLRQLDCGAVGIGAALRPGFASLEAKHAGWVPDFRAGDRSTPAAVFAIEGGDCLQGDPANVDAFHRSGVRLITLMHYTPNDIGDIMTGTARHGGLTPFGRQVVERMQALGMVVDAAHAHPLTLKAVAAIASGPIIDSHTSPAPPAEGGLKLPARMRSWEELEWIARTGGLVCTWPLKAQYGGWQRATIEDWARETVEIKRRIGIEHVALGTDGGGGLPRRVSGYDGYRDLGRLADALMTAGLSAAEVRVYLGGNFVRVFTSCIG